MVAREFREFQENGWWYRVSKATNENGYFVLAKKDKFMLPIFSGTEEPGELWFCFGETENEALNNLKMEVKEV